MDFWLQDCVASVVLSSEFGRPDCSFKKKKKKNVTAEEDSFCSVCSVYLTACVPQEIKK